MPIPTPYESGSAKDDALPHELHDARASDTDLPTDPALFDLSKEQYWEWLTSLVEKGSILDQQLDELLDAVYDCQPTFYNLRGRRRLQELLNELHDARASVRAYEYDVEELTYVFARTDVVETQAAENADLALSQLKGTYNRAYDLCLYKLDRMSDGWITASNFLISVIMLVVTILFWMEFR